MSRTEGRDTGIQGSIEQYLQPVSSRERDKQYVPQAAFRSINQCQQLLSAELGWPTPRSFNNWRAVQARQTMTQLQFPPVYDTFNGGQRHAVAVLELQQSSCSCNDTSQLAAVGYSNGMMHVIKVTDLLQTAGSATRTRQSSVATAPVSSVYTSSNSPLCSAAAAAVPAGAVMTIDLQDRLLSCCWAPASGGFAEMVTAGSEGVKIRRFVEARHHEYALKLKAGSQLAKAGPVKYLDRSAAYQIVAAKPGGLVLWDCRAASRAVVELAISSQAQHLQVMPGGTVLLTAAADGQVALYDVRRVSSNSSSVVNFGGSRTSQQLIASFNIAARAEKAAVEAVCSSSLSCDKAEASDPGHSSSTGCASSNSMRVYPYFADVQLNPVDCNLVAYVRLDYQVGLFDLYNNRVVQQVCVTETVGTAAGTMAGAAAAQIIGYPRSAPARGCWDPQGRVLYTHGLLRRCSSTDGSGAHSALQLQPTLAAVDFGSWHKRQLRRDISSNVGLQAVANVQDFGEDATAVPTGQQQHSSSSSNESTVWYLSCRGGQVLHSALAAQVVATELAVCRDNGEVFLGTMLGDVACVDCSLLS